jgi:NAD(P)H dehydrogenase (quinone)
MGKILIVFYTTYGHVYSMAKAVKEGVDKVEGCEGVLYQVWSPSPVRSEH